MKTAVFNLKGENVGEMDLPDKIFGRKWNADLVHQALNAEVANQRKHLAEARGRGEVSGGGKKPWRQKGTGRARHGSIRSPLWKGGGVSHGPKAERNFVKKINKKMKRAALYSALSKKLSVGELKVIDAFSVTPLKTKAIDAALKIFLSKPKSSKALSVLLVPGKASRGIYRIVANIPKVNSLSASTLNIGEVLKYKNIILEKDAVAELAGPKNPNQKSNE